MAERSLVKVTYAVSVSTAYVDRIIGDIEQRLRGVVKVVAGDVIVEEEEFSVKPILQARKQPQTDSDAEVGPGGEGDAGQEISGAASGQGTEREVGWDSSSDRATSSKRALKGRARGKIKR